MAIAILELGGVELRTSDPLTVQTLWRLMRTCVSDEEMRKVDGPINRAVDAAQIS